MLQTQRAYSALKHDGSLGHPIDPPDAASLRKEFPS
jgi:hypothetical protein